MPLTEPNFRLSARTTRLFYGLALLGGITLLCGLFLDAKRTCIDLFVISNYLVGLGLAAMVLVALHHVTGARWSLPVLPASNALISVLPIGALGILVVLFCYPSMYSWATAHGASVLDSPLKRIWLNWPAFLVRTVIYIIVWMLFAATIRRGNRLTDGNPDAYSKTKNVRLAAFFLVVFGVTCWLSSIDWLMSLEPEWASTIFPVYNFAGLILSGIAAVILIVIWLKKFSHMQKDITDQHLHDLGTLLFSFSSLWMYMWFCQYLLIWYVNNPEETGYYVRRRHGIGPEILYLDLALNWAIPFLVLLFRSAKRSSLILGTIAAIVLAGRCVDLAFMIFPSQTDVIPVPAALEAGMLLGTIALVVLTIFWALGTGESKYRRSLPRQHGLQPSA
jgi:hypothetical protein